MAKRAVPNVPFVQAHHIGSKQKPTAILLQISHTTSDQGAALAIAQRLHKTNAPPNSYHYIVDEARAYRGVPDDRAAYLATHRTINVLMCSQPHEAEPLWEDATAVPVLHRTAELVVELCLAHNIKPRYLDDEAYDHWYRHKWRRRGGIIVDVMGTWPYQSFIDDVNACIFVRKLGR
jgi:N-acetylmuramoyl-L-alanine amidase CwlA